VLNRHGVITGGSYDKAGDEVFEKRREIVELRGKVESLAETLASRQSSLAQEEELAQALSLEVEQTDRVVNELNMKEVGSARTLNDGSANSCFRAPTDSSCS